MGSECNKRTTQTGTGPKNLPHDWRTASRQEWRWEKRVATRVDEREEHGLAKGASLRA